MGGATFLGNMWIPDILIYKSPLAAHRLPMRGFTARNTLPSGSHRASTGVFPSAHGVSGPETGCMPYPSHVVLGTASGVAGRS